MTIKILTLSYRKGFLRLYAVLTAAWVIVSLLALPSNRLRVWDKPRTGIGKYFLADIEPEPTMSDADIGAAIKKSRTPTFADSRTGKTLWLAGMLFGPPIAGYLTAFLIVPWVYRGFRPTIQD